MELKKLIKSISKDIEILDSYTKKSFYGVDIEYVAFKIGNFYYLASKDIFYVITEQTPDRSQDISPATVFRRKGFIEYIKRLLILEN